MTSSADYGPPPGGRPGRVPLAERARLRGVHPIKSAHDLVREDVWESDEELLAFLEHLHVMRHSDLTGS